MPPALRTRLGVVPHLVDPLGPHPQIAQQSSAIAACSGSSSFSVTASIAAILASPRALIASGVTAGLIGSSSGSLTPRPADQRPQRGALQNKRRQDRAESQER